MIAADECSHVAFGTEYRWMSASWPTFWVMSGSSLEECGKTHWTDVLQLWMDDRRISQERGRASKKNGQINVRSVVE